MGIWDDITNIMSGGAQDAADEGYGDYEKYMDPYRKGGMEDYNRLRDSTQKWGEGLGKFSNAGNWMYGNINQSPNDFYDKIMSRYSESPESKYQQENALKASNAAGAASGMIGSGAMMKGLQENAAGIAGRDRDRYYNNVLGANDRQMGYLENLQGQQAQQRQMQQYLTSLGFGAAQGVGQNAIDRGNSKAKYRKSAMDDIYSMIGAAASGGMSGGMGGGGGQIPPYVKKAMGI